MTSPQAPLRSRIPARSRSVVAAGALLLPSVLLVGLSTGAASAADTRLGTADAFALLAGSTMTNTGVSTVQGDIGLHPGTALVGFELCTGPADCVQHTGAKHVTSGVAAQAKADMLTAYDELVALESTCTMVPVELGGTTLTPGVYCSATLGLTGTLTLSGVGEFIFLTGAGGSTLVTAAASEVLLTDGADPCNVYWQVATSATIGGGSRFAGNVLAAQSISLGAAATLQGSALATTAAVTMINNTITDTQCTAAGGTVDPVEPVETPPAEQPVVTPPAEQPVVTPPAEQPVGTPPAEQPVGTPPAEQPVVTPPTAGPTAAPTTASPTPAPAGAGSRPSQSPRLATGRATSRSTAVSSGTDLQHYSPVPRLPVTGSPLETLLTGAALTTGTGGLLLLLSWGLGRRRHVARHDVAG